MPSTAYLGVGRNNPHIAITMMPARSWHSLSIAEISDQLAASAEGLAAPEAERRLKTYGKTPSL